MKEILNLLINHQTLSKQEAKQVLTGLTTGKYNNSQIAAFMTIYLMRSIRVEELEGFRDAMLELCLPVDLEGYNTIDVCGTGGDGKNTFNISTMAAFILAGAKVHVAKHGNYGVSSLSGSSNVLEYMGCTFSNDVTLLKKSIEKSGICFMHAPLFHPAMKNVGPIRKELGVKTFFNMLGPMVNPASPPNQLVGVYNLELARLYGYLYQNTSKKFLIIHSLDGYDEITLTDNFKTISHKNEALISPEDLGMKKIHHNVLFGGNSVKESASIFMSILNNKSTVEQANVVCINAGMGISITKDISFEEGFHKAKESLESGKALESFKTFLNINK